MAKTDVNNPGHPQEHPKGGPPETSPIVKGIAITVGMAIVGVILWRWSGGDPVPGTEHYGFASVLPALLTLALVFLTRNVLVSLFLGILVGGLVIQQFNIVQVFLIPAIGTTSFALILLVYLWALGGLIGLWTRTGGAQHFAIWAGRKIVKGPRSAKFFAWLMGVIFHQGGTVSTVLCGTTVRAVADAEKVSHEETSFLVDATASPVATVVPLNAWPLYVSGLVVGTIPLFATEQEAVSFFFGALPYNFFAIFIVILSLLFAWEVLPWEGKRMRAARVRARLTGELNAPKAQPLTADELTVVKVAPGYRPGLEDFVVPLGVLIGWALTGVLPALWHWDLSLIGVPIAEAFGLSVLSAIVLALFKGMSIRDAIDGFIDGAKGVTVGAIILGLAVTLGFVSGKLGTADYIVEATAARIGDMSFLLPVTLLVVNMAIAFCIGSSWGAYAVVFPLAMPLAWAVNPDPYFITLCFSAVLGGAVFGDQTSPISDTTILSSLSTGADVMDHTYTQLPLALVAAALAGVLYTVLALFA